MDIDHHDRERRARHEWMINEFQEARRRRLLKTGDKAVKSSTTSGTKHPPAKPITSQS